ncbi:hypothetical protein Tco_1428590 [Tanacetum coccineum]
MFPSRVGIKINIIRAKIGGWGVSRSRVEDMASSLGCTIMENKFRYLGVMVGAGMTRHKAWDDVILKLQSRLSKWKAKTLSIGGRLTLLKSVLGCQHVGGKKFPGIAWDKDDSLWFRVIQAVHGDKIDSHSVRKVSIWSSILKESFQVLKSLDLISCVIALNSIGDGQILLVWKEDLDGGFLV